MRFGPLLVFALASPALAEPSLNLPATFHDTKQALLNSGVANILVLGDSLSWSDTGWLANFRQRMQAQYGNAGAGYQGLSRWTGGGLNPGWTEGVINTDVSPYRGLDGLWCAGSATNLSGYIDSLDRQVRLQYVAQPGGGLLNLYDANWNAVGQIDAGAPGAEVRQYSYTFPSDTGRLWFRTADERPFILLGQNNLGSEPGVRIHRAANGGWSTANFLQRDWTFDQQVALLHPDLIMIWLGQNEGADGMHDRLNSLVDRVLNDSPAAEILLVGTYDSGGSNVPGVVAAMHDVAQERSLGFVNLYEVAGSHQFFLDNNYTTDGLHFSAAGGQYMGGLFYNVFANDGASLVPEPGSVLVCLMAGAVLGTRRSRWTHSSAIQRQ